MASSSRSEIMKLYKQMLRAGQGFSSYNFREYAIRRVRDGFKIHKDETNADKISLFIEEAKSNLAIIQRQVTIGKMYHQDRIVIEKDNQ